MTPDERVEAVAKFGFTTRQARFLVMVTRHSGVCLPRQYAVFSGITYGQRTRAFFGKLVARRFASTCRCLHNRAVVYHVHHRAIYRAIGDPHSRLRRPVPAAAIVPRLMLLDAVLADPETIWLVDEIDKVAHFTTTAAVAVERLPHADFRSQSGTRVRYFPDRLPIGIDSAGRAVFLYLATCPPTGDLRAYIRRHAALLYDLPAWTLRLVHSAEDHPDRATYEALVRREFETILGLVGVDRGSVECQVLAHRYEHLSPLVARLSERRPGAEEGEQAGEQVSARPRPPLCVPASASLDSLSAARSSTSLTAKSFSPRHVDGQRGRIDARRPLPPVPADQGCLDEGTGA
jgi:hypothetical protein